MSRKNLNSRINSFLYNHIWVKYLTDYSFALLMTILSSLIFSFGVSVFLSPGVNDSSGSPIMTLISGGMSGASQIVVLVVQLINSDAVAAYRGIIYGVTYTILNIPLAIFAFKNIGIRFSIFTVLNFLFVTLFSSFLNTSTWPFLEELAIFVSEHGGMLARALFAGLCTGLSTAITFKIETSTGGVDIISYYLSIKKSTTAGKYSVMFNVVIVATYSILEGAAGISFDSTTNPWVSSIAGVFFSVVYLFTTMLVIDFINVRNKKVQVQIVTKQEKLSTYLIANIPHGATITHAKGAYSDDDRFIIYIVVSSLETKKVVNLVREVDPNSFVTVTPLQQVYGRFFMKPIK